MPSARPVHPHPDFLSWVKWSLTRRTVSSCTAGVLALFVVLIPVVPQAQGSGGPPAQPGQQGGLLALAARVQAIEAAMKQLQQDVAAETAVRMAADAAERADRAAADSTLQANIDAEATARAALQARITTLGDDMAALQELFASLNPAVNTAQQDIAALRTDLGALENAVAGLGGGLTSYDQLAGLPCKTGLNAVGFVHLVGLLRSQICAAGISANGRFIDLGPVVLDTQTGLQWEKKTTTVRSGQNLADLHDVDNTYGWCQANGDSTGFVCAGNVASWIGDVNAAGFAGFTDWRVPTLVELLTIVDLNIAMCGLGTLCVDPIFGPTQAYLYWSSTEFNVEFGRSVNFFNGSAVGLNGKTVKLHVRAVRAGP